LWEGWTQNATAESFFEEFKGDMNQTTKETTESAWLNELKKIYKENKLSYLRFGAEPRFEVTVAGKHCCWAKAQLLEEHFGGEDQGKARVISEKCLGLPVLKGKLLEKIYYFNDEMGKHVVESIETGTNPKWWETYGKHIGQISKLEFVTDILQQKTGFVNIQDAVSTYAGKVAQNIQDLGERKKRKYLDGRVAAVSPESLNQPRRLAALNERFQRVRDFQAQTDTK